MQKGISLKVAWYGLIVLVALAPVAILFPWLGSKAHSLLLERALSWEGHFNETIKTHVDHEVNRIITLLQNKTDPMAYTLAHTVDKDLLNGLLDAVIRREDAVHVLALVDPQGRLVAGKDRYGHPLSGTAGKGDAAGQKEGQADREPLFDPQGPEVVIPMHGRIYTGSPFTREGELNFYIAVPVGPPIQRPLAVLLATIDAGKLWRVVQAQLSRPGVTTYLVDSRGSLLAPPAGSAQPAGALLSHMDIVRSLIAHKDWVKTDTYIGLNGLSSFGSATHIDSLNWGVISEIPESTITGPIVATLVTMAVIVAALVVVFGALGLGLVNRMLGPMTALSGAFDRVARGDYSQAIPSSPVKEFNALSAGFNRMITERKRAEDELTRRARQQAAVAELGQRALAGSELSALMDQAVHRCAETLDVEYCKILELLPDGKALRLRSGVGWRQGLVGQATVGAGTDSHAGYTLLSNDPVIVTDLRTETRFSDPSLLHDHGVVSGMSVTIQTQERPFGVLGVHTSRRRTFSQDDVNFLRAVANMLAEAIERKRTEETVRNIAAGVSAQTGEAFFTSLVMHLAKLFDADYAFIGTLDKDDPFQINTLAMCAHGKIVDNISYSLAGTPCAEVIGQKTCTYPSGVQRLFPEDKLLMEMGIDSYIGTPLFGSRGAPLGNLVVLDDKPLRHTKQVGELLEIFAARAAAELERLRAEEELKSHRDHLEELVEERTQELHTAQEVLLRKERLATLGQLTATVSHELRNPLGTLRTSLYSVTDKLKSKKLGVDRALARMGRNITRCDNIIHEMLDFSRIQDLDLQPAPIDDLLAEVLAEQTATEGITIKQNLTAAAEAHVDRERLRRAIINVFDNACQAFSEMPEVDKRARVVTVGTRVRDHRLEITIDDTASGIPDTTLVHIFEPLYSTKGFGVGLGLSIVKQIMKQHGGGVEVNSEEGRGTHVVLWLPC